MTEYIQVKNLNCTHRKVLLTAKDFKQNELGIGFQPVSVCLECKKYEVIEFK